MQPLWESPREGISGESWAFPGSSQEIPGDPGNFLGGPEDFPGAPRGYPPRTPLYRFLKIDMMGGVKLGKVWAPKVDMKIDIVGGG